MKKFYTAAFACSAMLSVMPITAALALDGNDFADKLAKIIGTNGMQVDMGDVSTNGDVVTITGLSIAPPGEDKVTLDKPIVFSGVTEVGDSGYTAVEAKFDAFTFTADDVEISIGDILVEDIVIPADAAQDPMASIELYSHFLSGPVTGRIDGQEAFSIKSIEAFNTLDASGNVLTGTFDLQGFQANLASLQKNGMEELAMGSALGLDVINARVFSESVWQIDTGRLAIKQGLIDVADVGKLNITGEVLGYDEAAITALYELQREVAENPDATPEEMEAKSVEILQLMGEKLSMSKMSIRFDDASITGKVLAMIAAQSGTTPEIMASGFAATLPAMAAQFGAPLAIQTMLAEAAATYFADPQNLEISLAPAQPVPLMGAMAVMMDPSSLVTLFNLSIKANQ